VIGEEARIVKREQKRKKQAEVLERGLKECKLNSINRSSFIMSSWGVIRFRRQGVHQTIGASDVRRRIDQIYHSY
jgi:hypothetical protein